MEEEKRKCASLEKELSVMQEENVKWKNMCMAMEDRLRNEEKDVLAMESEEEEEVVVEVRPALKDKVSAKKVDTTVPVRAEVASVEAPRREKKDSAVTKERKMPKNIRQDPPSKGKASSSKEKISGKKQKLRQ